LGLQLCIRIRGRLGRLIRVIIIIIIAVVAARWEPSAVLPLIAGIGFGGWLVASLPMVTVELWPGESQNLIRR
jgi:hypothetical protein